MKRSTMLMLKMKMKMKMTMKKKMLKNGVEKSPNPNPNANPTIFRDWSGLPDHLLILILNHLSSTIDLLSAAAVSRSWRFAATTTSSSSSAAPFLLHPVLFLQRRHLAWSPPPRCNLQTLTPPPKLYSSIFSAKSLRLSCIGYSHSHLILLSHRRHVILANPFTGQEITSPAISGNFYFSLGIATAHPSSPSCLLLVVAHCRSADGYSDEFSIFCWRPGTSEWSELKLHGSTRIVSLIAFRGQVFFLDSLCRLIVVEWDPCLRWKHLPAQFLLLSFIYGKFGQHLAVCGGELLMVNFVLLIGDLVVDLSPVPVKIEVYSLDLSRFVWVRKESLGDWCLFIDAVGSCAMSCPNPGRWGGRRNCVYVAGPGYDGWSVFPLDGNAIDTAEDSALRATYLSCLKWPSPVWVCPTIGASKTESNAFKAVVENEQ